MQSKEMSNKIIVLINLLLSFRDSYGTGSYKIDNSTYLLLGVDGSIGIKIGQNANNNTVNDNGNIMSIDYNFVTSWHRTDYIIGYNIISLIFNGNKRSTSSLVNDEYVGFKYPSTEEEWECKLFQMSTTNIDDRILNNLNIGWYLTTHYIGIKRLKIYIKEMTAIYDDMIEYLNEKLNPGLFYEHKRD